MIQKMQKMVLFTLIVFIASFSVAMGGEKADAKNQGKTTIEPLKTYEDCIELSPDQILDYAFESLRPLDFNIHCHENDKIVYPFAKDGISSDRGSFQSEKQQYYCFMWTNPHAEPVGLKYEYRVKKCCEPAKP